MIDYSTYQESKKRNKLKMAESQRNNQVYRRNCLKNPTRAELMVKDWFEQNDIPFMFQKGFVTPFHRIADFYITKRTLKSKRGLIIEIDGGYHKDVVEKDKIKDERWDKERNMDTLRIKNEEVYNGSFKYKILQALEHTR